MPRRIPRLTGARTTNEQTRLMNFTPYLANAAGRGVLISFRVLAYAHCAHTPLLFYIRSPVSSRRTDAFGPLNLSLEPLLCGLVGRNGVGKTRLLRLLAGLDSPSGGHIERSATVAWVAQQPTLNAGTTVASLLGYACIFDALSRLEQGKGLADDFELLDGRWDLP